MSPSNMLCSSFCLVLPVLPGSCHPAEHKKQWREGECSAVKRGLGEHDIAPHSPVFTVPHCGGCAVGKALVTTTGPGRNPCCSYHVRNDVSEANQLQEVGTSPVRILAGGGRERHLNPTADFDGRPSRREKRAGGNPAEERRRVAAQDPSARAGRYGTGAG
ncbi:hypothetical protein SKAU_G00398940 [Synaphobranchus kaupii]|uniref:Secreted protein n=1 Tax=Synaphobranchus kaupii TaxID=118154 RepID=A0A9Q1E8N8_SYNKA|nr:hypothetical protein SKAU_G00398940 [Synaphobranchus kaupii]